MVLELIVDIMRQTKSEGLIRDILYHRTAILNLCCDRNYKPMFGAFFCALLEKTELLQFALTDEVEGRFFVNRLSSYLSEASVFQ